MVVGGVIPQRHPLFSSLSGGLLVPSQGGCANNTPHGPNGCPRGTHHSRRTLKDSKNQAKEKKKSDQRFYRLLTSGCSLLRSVCQDNALDAQVVSYCVRYGKSLVLYLERPGVQLCVGDAIDDSGGQKKWDTQLL